MPQPKDIGELMDKKTQPGYMLSIYRKSTLEQKDIHMLKIKKWKKLFQANRHEKKRWVAIFT